MKKEKKDTVGKKSRELLLKEDKHDHSALEQSSEQFKDYTSQIEQCLTSNKKKHNSDFYIVVLSKKEKLMKNVIRNYFFDRISCPTPDYDQIVYRYTFKDDQLKLLWVIPARDVCFFMKDYSLNLPPDQWELLSYILKFDSGDLFNYAKELNNEKKYSPELRN